MPRLLSFMLLSPQPSAKATTPSLPSLIQPVLDAVEAFRRHMQLQAVPVVARTPSLLAMTHVANLTSYLVRK
jgi:hypothetical protein